MPWRHLPYAQHYMNKEDRQSVHARNRAVQTAGLLRRNPGGGLLSLRKKEAKNLFGEGVCLWRKEDPLKKGGGTRRSAVSGQLRQSGRRSQPSGTVMLYARSGFPYRTCSPGAGFQAPVCPVFSLRRGIAGGDSAFCTKPTETIFTHESREYEGFGW